MSHKELEKLPVGDPLLFKAFDDDDLNVVREILQGGHPLACRQPGNFVTPASFVRSREMYELMKEYGFKPTSMEMIEAISTGGDTGHLAIGWMIEDGVSVNGNPKRLLGADHRVPLIAAIEWNKLQSFVTLAENGANLLYRDPLEGLHPLHFLAKTWGNIDRDEDLKRGDELYELSRTYYASLRETLAVMACMMLEAGEEIDVLDGLDQTALTHAIAWGGENSVRFFVERGADLLRIDPRSKLPISHTRFEATRCVIEKLMEEYYEVDPETGEITRRPDSQYPRH